MAGSAQPLARQRQVILGVLLALAVAGWVALIRQSSSADDDMMSPTMGMSAALFLGIWITMMVAMMFPTAAPMILAFGSIQAGKRQREQTFVPTWIFVAAYLAVWSAFGLLAYVAAIGAEQLANESMWVMDHAGQLGGVLLILAGAYQFSKLKRVCLSKCRTPLQFIMTSWRDGRAGALRMGLEHGAYCAGCCWLLFAILFPLGVMNLAAMAALTALIFVEKSLPAGQTVGRVAAIALIAYGLAVVIVPSLLPTTM